MLDSWYYVGVELASPQMNFCVLQLFVFILTRVFVVLQEACSANNMEPDPELVAALFADREVCPDWGTWEGCIKGRKCPMMHGPPDTHPRTSLCPTKYLLKNSFQVFERIQ